MIPDQWLPGPMRYDPNRALDLLRAGTSVATAEFRNGQEEAILHLVEGRGRLLVARACGPPR